jgi:16S rRNA (cytosine967-C5)-methyltransferase
MSRPPRKPLVSVTSARFEAFTALMEVERAPQAHADDLLRGARVSALSDQDRNLCTALVMGTLRWQIRLDGLIRAQLSRPNARLDLPVRVALRLGAFQLQYMDRIPAHAAIGESVELAKLAGHTFAARMVNAVLRGLAAQARPDALAAELSVAELAAATAHPEWLVERWARFYGMERARAICEHGQRQPELAVRLEDDLVEAELAAAGVELVPGTLLTAARRVVAGDVTATEAFRSGRLRIQEEGSQLIAELAGKGSRILDCCAAPGGKTLILAERNPASHITACELSPARLDTMRLRIKTTAHADRIELRQADAADLSEAEGFDLVLADVPCSGTGTLGRNPEIRHRLQEADLARHHDRQCAILRGALRAGTRRVIYSTCSLEPEENAAVVGEVLAADATWRQVSAADGFRELRAEGRLTELGLDRLLPGVAADGSLTLLPGSLGPEMASDGFFIAILEKAC